MWITICMKWIDQGQTYVTRYRRWEVGATPPRCWYTCAALPAAYSSSAIAWSSGLPDSVNSIQRCVRSIRPLDFIIKVFFQCFITRKLLLYHWGPGRRLTQPNACKIVFPRPSWPPRNVMAFSPPIHSDIQNKNCIKTKLILIYKIISFKTITLLYTV